jgi:NAD(P)-dependent dehydrogenase (short-subunit alcohol dehydrogenase family)
MFTLADMPDLQHRTAVVTGANSGLGLATARALAGAGATVLMTARSREKYEAAAATLPDDVDARFVELDLASLASVRQAAAAIGEQVERLDILVNNAGIMLTPKATTAYGLELQLGTNHFGHFALTGLLLDRLLAADEARVTTVSSLAHHMGVMDFDDLHQQQRDTYDSTAAYARSKLANLLFAFELQRRFDAAALPHRSTAAHPGYTATNLQTTGVSMAGGGLFHRIARPAMKLGNALFGMSVEQGALPQIHAAVSNVPGGSYWGPQGFREARGPVGPAKVNPKARDEATARRLWEVSVETTGVDYAALDQAASRG